MSGIPDGRRRREIVRSVLGKPGSLRRWLLGTGVWLLACMMLFLQVGWVARIAVFLAAAAVSISSFRARALVTGDEDEMRAAVRLAVRQRKDFSESDEDEIRMEPEDWLSRRPRPFDQAPPPPVAEDEWQEPAQSE